MSTTLVRTAHADRTLGAHARIPGAEVPPEVDEDRAARRDALIHALALARPRRCRQQLRATSRGR